MVRDMTTEKPIRLFLSFGVPILMGSLLQQLYNVVDSMIVGRALGVNALAAVGSVGVLYFLVLDFVHGVCNGFSIPVSQSFGAGDTAAIRRHIAAAIWLPFWIGLFLTAVLLLLTKPFLIWIRTPEAVLTDAYHYIRLLFAGILILFFYNLPASMLRALGDSKTPLTFLILSSFLNILLDLLFIVMLQKGTKGAAAATILAQLVSGILCVFYMKRRFSEFFPKRGDWKLSAAEIQTLLSMGIPQGLEFSFTSLGSIVLQSAVNSLGSAVVAATSIGGKLSSLFGEPMEALAITLGTYSGQNKGAGKTERIQNGIRQGLLLGAGYAILAGLFLAFFGKTMALLFFDAKEADVLAYTESFLLANGIGYPLLSFLFILRSVLQGLGYSFLSMFAGVAEMIARIFIALLLVAPWGYGIICYTNLLAWIAADVFLFSAFFSVRKKLLT